MTPTAKALLHNYGLLYISISALSHERVGSNLKTLEEYDATLGPIAKDEPVVVVRISSTDEHKFTSVEDAGISLTGEDGNAPHNVSVLEMPEDEFYFFGAFRKGLFEIRNELPTFIFGLGHVYAYTLFESYLADVLKDRLAKHPKCMGTKKQVDYSVIFDAPSKEALMDVLVGREVRDVLYLPIDKLLAQLRSNYGFSALPAKRDHSIKRIALERNCFMHNDSNADAKLAAEFPDAYSEGDPIEFTQTFFNSTINTLRHFCISLDRAWETLS